MDENIPKKLKIAIAGAGGIGSHLVAQLYDFGVNREQFPFVDYVFDVYDDDTVDKSNLLHQNYSDQDIGNLKVNSLAERYAVTPIQRFMTKEDFKQYDIILCGVDSMNFRRDLYEWSWANPDVKTFWIDGRCTSRQGAVLNKTVPKERLESLLGEVSEGPEVRTGCLYQFEKEQEMAHALPIITAGIILQTFLNFLRGHKPLTEKQYMI